MKIRNIFKVKKRLQNLLNETVLAISPIKCEGSEMYPDCRLPIVISMQQMKERDFILNACFTSDIQEEKELGAYLNGLCYLCVAEHPKIKPYFKHKGGFKIMRQIRFLTKKLDDNLGSR